MKKRIADFLLITLSMFAALAGASQLSNWGNKQAIAQLSLRISKLEGDQAMVRYDQAMERYSETTDISNLRAAMLKRSNAVLARDADALARSAKDLATCTKQVLQLQSGCDGR